jgi:hypothetical protein
MRLAKQQGQSLPKCLRETTTRELRLWEEFWKLELQCPERAEYYAAQTANEVARLSSITLQIATVRPGGSIDPNKVKLSEMIMKFDDKPVKPPTREEAARRSKAVWAVRLGYTEVPR